jgi:RimJ/RimL family protein N-acetyltransferase
MDRVLLRDARDYDAVLVLAWRSIPKVYAGLYTQSREDRVPTWDEHWKWWKSRTTWKIFIIQVNDGETTRDVGYLNIAQLDHWRPEVGLGIGEVTLWGQGIAKQALLFGIEWLKEHGYKRVHTSILKNNERSIKLFTSLGFKIMGDAREDEIEVELWIS